MFIITVVLGSFTFGIGGLISGIVFSFVHNKIYIKELLEKGYLPANENAESVLQSSGITA
ncbi:hypothetical protein [Peribacillus sp. NPDC097895]|uniref:hypothetical protein n=1 Tax=Peribacillus sp. NPDC097895 TaxID=3390619 RepID=UPI003CFC64C3